MSDKQLACWLKVVYKIKPSTTRAARGRLLRAGLIAKAQPVRNEQGRLVERWVWIGKTV
jgi:hypothetical protein